MSDNESVELPPQEEEKPVAPTKSTKPKGSKRPATEERLEILRKAREKAAEVRKEKARVRQAEKAMKQDAFNERKKKADAYLAGKTDKLPTKKKEQIFSREASEDEEEIEYVKKPKKKSTKKPKKKVVYITDSESEEEEQVVRVKKSKVRPTPTPPPTPQSFYDPITARTIML